MVRATYKRVRRPYRGVKGDDCKEERRYLRFYIINAIKYEPGFFFSYPDIYYTVAALAKSSMCYRKQSVK
jgi:hypothetical protein